MLFKDTHFKYRHIKSKGIESYYANASTNRKKAGAAIFISKETDLRARITGTKRGTA